MKILSSRIFVVVPLITAFTACNKDVRPDKPAKTTITIENVLQSKPLVETGIFQQNGATAVTLPGQSISFSFSAAKNQRVSFATMYGWSNDLFFAPENPGLTLYREDGTPVTGDVSSQIKLWDNGTRVNQKPGAQVTHPGNAESAGRAIKQITGVDEYGNNYLEASQLMKASLDYKGNSTFVLTLTNNTEGTPNETPFSPGVWAISYVAGGNLLLPEPIYSSGKPTANGLTNIAEAGSIEMMSKYLSENTGIFTPLSPALVVVYEGAENPFFETGETDRGQGLKELAQMGNAEVLASNLKKQAGVKSVYILSEPETTVLLPSMNGNAGGKVSKEIQVVKGDRVAVATMYGFSNDWFFATAGNGFDPLEKGDHSKLVGLYDNGTAINQFPGAGITQFNLAGTPLKESLPITAVSLNNGFTILPSIENIISVKIQ